MDRILLNRITQLALENPSFKDKDQNTLKPPAPSRTPTNPEAEGYTLLTSGWTSKIYYHPLTRKILKYFPSPGTPHYIAEKTAYDLLYSDYPPPSIPPYYCPSFLFPDQGILLARAELGDLREILYRARRMGPRVSPRQFMRWARQIAEALHYAHGLGVRNGDIYLSNILLVQRLNSEGEKVLDVQVTDWAGASINGSQSCSHYRLTHQLWDEDRVEMDGEGKRVPMKIDVRSEIFALGSCLYEMAGGGDLWQGELEYKRDREEIVRRLRGREMPSTEDLDCLGDVIGKCWRVEFGTMKDVIWAVGDEERGFVESEEESEESWRKKQKELCEKRGMAW